MDNFGRKLTRRHTLALGGGAAVATLAFDWSAFAQLASSVERRVIPHSGEMLPVVGVGTARVYDFELPAMP